MRTRGILAVAAIAAMCAALPAQATVLAEWNFQTNTPADLPNSAAGPVVAAEGGVNAGASSAQGIHANAATDWTTPSGNGSTESYSVNTWELGDYTRFTSSSAGGLGYKDITIQWDQTSSNTGPRDFDLEWSTDNVVYTSLLSYQVLANAAPNNPWNITTADPAYTTGPILGPAALDNQATIYFRLRMTSTVSANGTTVASGGTNRVDNIIISGTPIPEPATLALLACGGLAMIRRRK